MPEVYPDASHTRKFFDVDAFGDATVQDGDLVISFSGLKALPKGSRYFIVLAATPIPAGPDRP